MKLHGRFLPRLAVLGALLSTAFVGLAPAFAQAPPAVPALPDSERRTAYSLSSSTCAACSVGFALYGDGTDYANWFEVWIITGSGTAAVATKLTAVTDYTLSSATGSLASIPRPITDGTITLATARTGTLEIVGARRPRRLSQFAENRGVAARDLNQTVTDLVAENRELWDKMGRALIATPGDSIGALPVAAVRAGGIACYDGSGNPTVCAAGSSGTANVVGPNISVVGHIATFGNTAGTLLLDGGLVGAGDFVGPASSTVDHAVTFAGSTGKVGKDSGLTLTASTGTFTLTNAKTLAVTNTLTLSGTDSTVMTFPTTSATLARTDAANTFTGHQTIEGVTTTGATGTGKLVFDTAPVLGAITVTSVNKMAVTAPATSSTLAVADGKTFTVSNTLTLNGTDGKALTVTNSGTLAGGDAFTLAIAAGKTLTASASLTLAGTDAKTLTINNSGTISGGDAWTLAIAASKTLTVSNTLTFTGTDSTSFAFPPTSDTVVTLAATQTLSSKTITAPTINGGTAQALTNFGIRSSGTGAFDLVLANTENLTAQRSLTLTLNNANRVLNLSGDLTTAAAFTTSGAFALTLTTTGTTNITVPTSGTLATQNVSNTFSATNTFSAANTFTATTTLADIKSSTGKIYPSVDSTTALQVTKADGTTRVMDFDTTNARVGINKTPSFDLDVSGTIGFTTLDATSLASSISTITGLTANNSPTAANDYLPYYSAADGKIRKITISALVSGAVAGVSNINGLSGALTIAAGAGISVSSSVATITISDYLDPGSITNCTLTGTVSGNALTVALKTQAGSDPSSSAPCYISFRNSAAATGDYTAVAVTAATSFATGTSGSTFGSSNNVAFRLWITAINNGGTVVLGASNQSTATQIYPLNESAVQSSTACSACTTATSAGVFYSTAAQTSKAIRILGYMDWASGLATAGTWASGPTTIQMMGPGVYRPGQVIQTIYATNTTIQGTTNTTYTATGISQAITPTSSPNLILVEADGVVEQTTAAAYALAQLARTDNTHMFGNEAEYLQVATANGIVPAHLKGFDKPNTSSSVSYLIMIKRGTASGTATWGDGFTSTLTVNEIMG